MSYDDSDIMTPADEASWLELVRVAPFKKAWSEDDGWTWTSPSENRVDGECEGHVVIAKTYDGKTWAAGQIDREPDFLGSTAFSAMKALMACYMFE